MPALLVTAIVVFLEIVCLGATIPVLPRFTESLGGSTAYVGILFALITAPKILLNPIWGRMSDRFGRKNIFLLAVLGSLAASILWAISGNLTLLTLSRVVGGLFAAQAAMAYTIAADTSTIQKRSAAMGLLGAAFGLGMTVGLPLGGIVGEVSYAAVGWLMTGIQALEVLIILFFLKETRPQPSETQPVVTLGEIIHLARTPRVRIVLVAVLLSTAAVAVIIPTLSLLTDHWYGWNMRTTGYAFAVWGLIGIVVQGGLIRPTVRAIGEKLTIVLGSALLALGLAFIASEPALPLFWTALVLIGIGGGFAVPATTGLISLQVTAAQQGGIQGLNQSATSLGRALGYIPAAYLLDVFGTPAAYGTAALAAVAAGIVILTTKIPDSRNLD